jgi:heterokaryon incompatibility protein (HET)
LFQDRISGIEVAKKKIAFTKLQYTCWQAERDGLEYCWIDTCAIDKRSSAELQEAINSMYRWYQKAKVCYAYLSDVEDTNPSSPQFIIARWFTRGWTL